MDADDAELVAGLQRGDPAAFDRAYARYRARVYAFLLRLSGRREVADDLLQETWMKLARSAPTLRPDTSLRAWLFTVARNEFISWRRWAMLDVTRLVSFGAEQGDARAGAPDARTEAAARLARVENALAELSPASREVLLLVGVEGMDQAEVAAILGVGYDALRQRLSRARAELAARVLAHEKRAATTRKAERGTA